MNLKKFYFYFVIIYFLKDSLIRYLIYLKFICYPRTLSLIFLKLMNFTLNRISLGANLILIFISNIVRFINLMLIFIFNINLFILRIVIFHIILCSPFCLIYLKYFPLDKISFLNLHKLRRFLKKFSFQMNS